jgi:hypothetical protein
MTPARANGLKLVMGTLFITLPLADVPVVPPLPFRPEPNHCHFLN